MKDNKNASADTGSNAPETKTTKASIVKIPKIDIPDKAWLWSVLAIALFVFVYAAIGGGLINASFIVVIGGWAFYIAKKIYKRDEAGRTAVLSACKGFIGICAIAFILKIGSMLFGF